MSRCPTVRWTPVHHAMRRRREIPRACLVERTADGVRHTVQRLSDARAACTAPIVTWRPSVPRYMHDSPAASATPSSVARYGGDTNTPTYTSASFAESRVHGSGVAPPMRSRRRCRAPRLCSTGWRSCRSPSCCRTRAPQRRYSAGRARPWAVRERSTSGVPPREMNTARPRLRLTRTYSETAVIRALRWGYGGCTPSARLPADDIPITCIHHRSCRLLSSQPSLRALPREPRHYGHASSRGRPCRRRFAT